MRSLSTRTTGLLIVALGAWGGLVPFIGHYFHFALGPDKSWAWTTGRLWLSVLPAAAAVLGGLMLIGAGPRPSARLGALLAIAAGIWFAIGPDISHLWNAVGAQGAAHGSKTIRVLEMLAYHTGLGALLAALGGYALPRFVAVPEVVAEPGAAGTRRPVTARRTASDEALAGGAVAAERERTGTTAPASASARAREEYARDEYADDAPTTASPREERAPDPVARPTGDAETATTPAARPVASEPRDEPLTAPVSTPAAAEPRNEPVSAPASARTAGGAGRSADAGPSTVAGQSTGATPTGAGEPGAHPHSVRRRRGGLLSALFSRR